MFSQATEYALRATIYIAQKSSEENKLGIEEIAKAIDSPKSFTAKIMQSLTKDNQVVRSVRGPNGGFYQTDKERKLSLREMLDKCVLGLKKCSEVNPCPMHFQYKPIKKEMMTMFVEKTIQQLADEMNDGGLFIKNKKR